MLNLNIIYDEKTKCKKIEFIPDFLLGTFQKNNVEANMIQDNISFNKDINLSKTNVYTECSFQYCSNLTIIQKLNFYYRNDDFLKCFIENTTIKSNERNLKELLLKFEY